jgi:hypothetical protein
MQTFEATDMLIRRRKPDTELHVVLWQVGVIGEMGYRRGGFLNNGLSVLIEYLQSFYGNDYPAVNYIGSRYPGVPPTIDSLPLSRLHDPEVQAKITGISTFYLAPRDVAAADLEMMKRLGLAGPGTILRRQEAPLRTIDEYGDKERIAVAEFARFKVPRGYQWQEDTAAARFLLALQADTSLREAYQRDPAKTVSNGLFPSLSAYERSMLATRDAGAVQLVAKGFTGFRRTNTPLLEKVLWSKPLARSLHRAFKQGGEVAIGTWAAEHGFQYDSPSMLEDWEALRRNRLYPWTGAYVSLSPSVFVFLLGNKRSTGQDRVFINGDEIRGAGFSRGRMKWRTKDGNPHNGYVHMDTLPSGQRRLSGSIWPDGEAVPANHRFTAVEADSGRYQLCQFTGSYQAGESRYTVIIERSKGAVMLRDGIPAGEMPHLESGGLRVGDMLIPFRSLIRDGRIPEPLRGQFRVPLRSGAAIFEVTESGLSINGFPTQQTFSAGTLRWTGGPRGFTEGSATLLIDPITLLAQCYGTASGAGAFTGMIPAGQNGQEPLREPCFGFPDWAWGHLTAIAGRASHHGGLFLWNAWERHTLTNRLVHAVIFRKERRG